MNRGIKFASLTICLALIGFMALIMSRQHREETAFRAKMESLQEQAQPYETELNRIRSELLQKSNETKYVSETGTIVIAHYIRSVDQIPEENSVVMVDCEADETLIRALDNWDGGIVLLCSSIDTELLSEMKQKLEPDGFLLPNKFKSEENIALLQSLGFNIYVGFADSYDNEQRDDGLVVIRYVYVKNNNYSIADRISAAVNERSVLMIVFDGELDEAVEKSNMELIAEQVDSGYLRYGTIASATEIIRSGDEVLAEKELEFEQYKETQNERMRELEQVIDDIYAGDE